MSEREERTVMRNEYLLLSLKQKEATIIHSTYMTMHYNVFVRLFKPLKAYQRKRNMHSRGNSNEWER